MKMGTQFSKDISIHAPRVGSDFVIFRVEWPSSLFQSTLPVWGATNAVPLRKSGLGISIHAPRVGSDHRRNQPDRCTRDFNPRSPCGERPEKLMRLADAVRISIHAPRVGSDVTQKCFKTQQTIFQSTLPVWGATMCIWISGIKKEFQSTLPVWGATQCDMPSANNVWDFNPRSPCGERR